MKKMHLPTRLLAMLLALALLCGFAVPVDAAGSSSETVTFQQVDNSRVSESLRGEPADLESESDVPEYAGTDMVRVSIFLEEASTVKAGYSTEGIAANKAALSYRAGLQSAQDALTASIEKTTAGSWMWSGT